MKLGVFASALVLGFSALTSNLFGQSVDCADVEVSEAESSDYSFNGTRTCTFESTKSTSEVREQMMQVLRSTGTVSREEKTSVNGMEGSRFRFVDRGYDTGHGSITISFDGKLVSDEDRVSYEGVMVSKVADGYANNTQAVSLTISVERNGNKFQVTFNKFTTVSKPGLAPKKLFKKKVAEGLEKEVLLLANPFETMFERL